MSILIACADAARLPLRDGSCDLVIGSPPYCEARTYFEDGRDMGIARGCAEWVAWMLGVTAEALRVSRGLVIWVCAGVTRGRNYQPAPEGLLWEWWRRGGECHCLRPCYWHRVGIPGSGGDQWYRADVEYVLAFKRPGKLPWSDNTANGHTPVYAPGGAMSYRDRDGTRANHFGVRQDVSIGARRHGRKTKAEGYRAKSNVITRRRAPDGVRDPDQEYSPPVLANPGNLLHTNAGGNHLGSSLAHENEAPYPVEVPAWYIASHCPPGGLVCDPFSGSGTTGHAALSLGRRYVGFDLRPGQCRLGRKRLRTVTPGFPFGPEGGGGCRP